MLWAHICTLYVEISWQNNAFLSIQYYKNTQRSFTKYTHTLVSGQSAHREEATVKQRCIKQIFLTICYIPVNYYFQVKFGKIHPITYCILVQETRSFYKTMLHRQPCLQNLKYNTFWFKNV